MFALPEFNDSIVALLMVGIISSLTLDLLKMLMNARKREQVNGFKSYTLLYEFISKPGSWHSMPHGNVCIVAKHDTVIPFQVKTADVRTDTFLQEALANASMVAVPSADTDWHDVVKDPMATPRVPSGFEATVVIHRRAVGAPWTATDLGTPPSPLLTKTALIHIPTVLSSADLQSCVVRAALQNASLVASKSNVDGYFLVARL